jgi:hypothetical protein
MGAMDLVAMSRRIMTSTKSPIGNHASGTTTGAAMALMALGMALAPQAALADAKKPPGAPGPGHRPRPGIATRVKQTSFAPPLASAALPRPAQAGGLPDSVMSLQGRDLLSPETARVIATMTPEQIDALTLLLLSLAGGAGGVAANGPAGGAATTEAPWIGNWSDDQKLSNDAPIPADAAMTPANSILPQPWRLVEEADGALIVEIPQDPFSRIAVQQGMILGALGEVATLETSEAVVVVRFADDQEITAPRHPDVVQAEQHARAAALPAPDLPAEMPDDAPGGVAGGATAQPEADLAVATAAPAAEVVAEAQTEGALWVQVASFRAAATVARLAASLREDGKPWVGRKIAGPSDAGLPPQTGQARPFASRCPRSSPDSRDRGAGVPRRCLQPKSHRRSHRSPGSATSMYPAPSFNPRQSPHTHGVKRFQHREAEKRLGRMQQMMPLQHHLAQGVTECRNADPEAADSLFASSSAPDGAVFQRSRWTCRPLMFSLGLHMHSGHAHDGGARKRRIAARMARMIGLVTATSDIWKVMARA